VKSTIWAVSLGSGTSGGVLAPLLMMGGALGALVGGVLPYEGAGFWPLIAMSAILGGTMRSPFTGIVFGLELTHDVNALLPLLAAVVVAHAFTVLLLPRSILTEKVSRRGYHLARDYAIDPLETALVREAMRSDILALPAAAPLSEVAEALHSNHGERRQRLYPVLGPQRELCGVVTRLALRQAIVRSAPNDGTAPLATLVNPHPIVAYPDETLRTVVYRMAESGRTRLPVVERDGSRQLVGLIALRDLLRVRARHLAEERSRERILRVPFRVPRRLRRFDRPLHADQAS
jgi:CBS domain-containing protein